LAHLKAENIKLLSTVSDMTEERAAQCFVFDGMTSWSARGPGVKLGKASTATQKPVADWWRQIIYVVRQGSILRRRDLVLAASNKDGGAHLDANLTPEYETLATNMWMQRERGESEPRALDNIHVIGLRQLGYEILNSIELAALT